MLWKWLASSRRAGEVGESAKRGRVGDKGSGAWKGGEVREGVCEASEVGGWGNSAKGGYAKAAAIGGCGGGC
jgi:hypothetical protein